MLGGRRAGRQVAESGERDWRGRISRHGDRLLQRALKLRLRLEERLARLAASDPGIGLFERPELLDRVELVRSRQEEIGRAAGAVILAAANLARWVAATVLLAGVEPLLALLPLTGLASAAAADAGRRLVQDAESRRWSRAGWLSTCSRRR